MPNNNSFKDSNERAKLLEQAVNYEVQSRRNAIARTERELAEKQKWKDAEYKAELDKLKQAAQTELNSSPKEFQELYKKYLEIGNRVHSLRIYGTTNRRAEIEKLEQEAEEIRQKMLSIPHQGFSIVLKPVLSFVSTVNPENVLEQKADGSFKLKGYDFGSNVTIVTDEETGLPTKVISKKRILRLFNEPVEVPMQYDITYITEEELAKKTEEQKKRKTSRIKIPRAKKYSCVKCHHVNDGRNKHCSNCGYTKQSFQ